MANCRIPGVIGVHDPIEKVCRLPYPSDFQCFPETPDYFHTYVSPIGVNAPFECTPDQRGPLGINYWAGHTGMTCQFVSNRPADEMEGQLTYDAEGNDDPNSPHFSRKPHVPGSWSGVTLGRGYDMKLKSSAKITAELIQAGISEEIAGKFAGASGKQGDEASKYLKDNGLDDITITLEQQEKLFAISYTEIKQDVKRICEKIDVVAKYGAVDINAIHYAIHDVVIDLRFRGDYTPASRQKIQTHIVNNDLSAFKQVLCNRSQWQQVPQDRFKRRCQYLTKAN